MRTQWSAGPLVMPQSIVLPKPRAPRVSFEERAVPTVATARILNKDLFRAGWKKKVGTRVSTQCRARDVWRARCR